MSTGPSLSGASTVRLVLVLLALAACGERTPTSPGTNEADLARGGKTAKGPTVKSTNPSFAPRGTTLDVQVLGSGYDQGSRAVWALNGDTAFAVTRVRTNSTAFVSSTELRANITIEADAAVDRYDVVAVTSGGKKGIGLELFAVTLEVLDLGVGDGSAAMAINNDNRVVGFGGATGAFTWQDGVVTALAPLPRSTGAQAEDINTAGWIVGTSSDATGGHRAVLWIPDAGGSYGTPIDLGTLGGCCSQATAINDNGVIAGHGSLPGDAGSHAVYWDANRQIHDIHTVQGGESFAWGINGLGHVVGQWNGPAHQQAFRYAPGAVMELLPGLGGLQGVALDINNLGQAVGWSGPSIDDPLRATLWEGSTMTDIGTAGGASSVGWAIDDDGWVVGRTDTGLRRSGALQFVAFVWNATDEMRILGLPTGSDYAQATDINSTGWIVGESWLVRGINRATLWRPQSP